MNGDVVSQFWVDIWAVAIVKVTGIDSCIRDLGTLNQKLGHCLWPRHNNGAHTTSAATELNSLKMLFLSIQLVSIILFKHWSLVCLFLCLYSWSKLENNSVPFSTTNTFSSLIIMYICTSYCSLVIQSSRYNNVAFNGLMLNSSWNLTKFGEIIIQLKRMLNIKYL